MGVNAETPVSPLPNMCWYVGLRGDERASTDRACLRRVAAPIMSTWVVTDALPESAALAAPVIARWYYGPPQSLGDTPTVGFGSE